MAIIGIDLGTTNSLAAVYQGDKSILIPNRHGDFLTPSVVGVDEKGDVLVGKIARDMLITRPGTSTSLFKRDMGTQKKVKLGTHHFLPEELSSFVIRNLISDAEAFLQEKVTEAVISVPAYFDAKKRAATKLAGQLAGIKVERLVNEPSAAALASRSEEEEAFVVFDFGGGTLDVSVVEAFDNIISICAISGNNFLGGADFDHIISQAICSENGLAVNKLPEQEREILLYMAEKAKIQLTEESEASIRVKLQGREIEFLLTNEKLYKMSAAIFSRIKTPIQSAINDSGLELKDIGRCILIGGSCHMPVVRNYLEDLLRVPVAVSEEPDEIVARGLGLYVGIKERSASMRDIVLTDVCPFSLNANVHNESNPVKQLSHTIIPRNSVLPTSRTDRLHTLNPGQKQMRINVNQGEEMYVDDNLSLGNLNIEMPYNKTEHESCEITYYYDINAILIVHVKVLSTGEEYKLVLTGDGLTLSDKEIRKYMARIKDMKLAHVEQADILLERAKAIYAQGGESIKAYIKQLLPMLEETATGSIRVRKEQIDTIKRNLDEIEKHFNRGDIFNHVPGSDNLIDITQYFTNPPPKR